MHASTSAVRHCCNNLEKKVATNETFDLKECVEVLLHGDHKLQFNNNIRVISFKDEIDFTEFLCGSLLLL